MKQGLLAQVKLNVAVTALLSVPKLVSPKSLQGTAWCASSLMASLVVSTLHPTVLCRYRNTPFICLLYFLN